MTPPEDPDSVRARAAEGFSRSVDAYERGRPGYPRTALDWLAGEVPLRAGARVLDLGAGTGKLTRALVGRGFAPLAAAEPLAPMRARLRSLDGVRILAGRAEALPLRDGSLDAVLCAEAFHWFEAERAADEAARVLRPGGALALLWNVKDDSVPWVAAVAALLAPLKPRYLRHASGTWRSGFDGRPGFAPLVERVFPHLHAQAPEGVIDHVASLSYVSSLPDAEREATLELVRDLLRTHPDTRSRATIPLPYRTEVHLARRTR